MATHPNIAAIDDILTRVRSNVVSDFLHYMRQIHPADRLPARRDFDIAAVPHLLPNMVLVQVERQPAPQPARFFVRVAGEIILEAAPSPMMNRYIDEIVATNARLSGRPASVILDVRQQVLQTGLSYYWHGPPRMKFRHDYADLEYVHCPLANDGITIDRIISVFYYHGATD
ncbi:hypothetical protein [Ferrovibrio sp.]|uniref:hypothetical protein n=1 Tax=Ferrovibrio sp. TaxID=1917215 RepID=UPI0035B3B93A